jgi:membrane protease YdiL (CAAX protease family)
VAEPSEPTRPAAPADGPTPYPPPVPPPVDPWGQPGPSNPAPPPVDPWGQPGPPSLGPDRPEWLAPAPPPPVIGGPPEPPAPTRAGRDPLPAPVISRTSMVGELLVVMIMAFAPALAAMVLSGGGGGEVNPETDIAAAGIGILITILLTWSPVLVLAFILSRNGEGPRTIGLGRPRGSDLSWGLGLWVTSHVLVLILAAIVAGLGSNDVDFLPRGVPLWFLVVQSLVVAVTAGVTEEVMVRGYAMTRLEQLGVPAALIVLAPTAIWSLLHAYQGFGPVVVIFGLGLLWAYWFWRTRRLWPVLIAHVLYDLTILVVIMATR